MSRKTRKLIWSAPLVAVFAVVGALAAFGALGLGGVFADELSDEPMNLTVKAADGNTGRTTLVLNWEAPASGAPDMYRIDVSTDNDKYKFLTEVSGTTLTYEHLVRSRGMDRKGTDGWERFYRVYAKNSHGYGSVSTAESATTKALDVSGEVGSVKAAGKSPTEIELTWAAPDDGGSDIMGYCILVWPTNTSGTVSPVNDANCKDAFMSDGPGGSAGMYRAGGNTGANDQTGGVIRIEPGTSYIHKKDMRAGQDWTYRVYAFNRYGNSDTTSGAFSAQAKAATQPTPPGNPLALQMEETPVDDSQGVTVNLYWTAPMDGGQDISGYRVEVSNKSNYWPSSAFTTVDALTSTDKISNQALAADTGDPATPDAMVAIITMEVASQTADEPYQLQHDLGGVGSRTLYYRVRTITGTGASEMMSTYSSTSIKVVDSVAASDGPDNTQNTADDVAEVIFMEPIEAPGLAADGTTAQDTNGDDDSATDDDRTPGQVNLTVTQNTDGANSYRVDVSEDDGATWTTVETATRPIDGTTYEHEGLKPGASRHFRLFAKKGTAYGLSSIVVEDSSGNSKAASKVLELGASADGAGKINVSWKAPAKTGGSDIDKYCIVVNQVNDSDVEQGTPVSRASIETRTAATQTTDGDTPRASNCTRLGESDVMPLKMPTATPQNAVFEVDADTAMVTLAGLPQKTRWQFEVFALNDASDMDADDASPDPDADGLHGVAKSGDTVAAKTGAASKPGAPQNLTAQLARDTNEVEGIGNQGVLLLWNPPADPAGAPVLTYKIERKVNDAEFEARVDSHPAGMTHWVDKSEPAADETRAYRITAINAAGLGAEMATVMIPYPPTHTTHDVASTDIMPVSGLDAVAGTVAGTADVSWTAGANATMHWIYAIRADEMEGGYTFMQTSSNSSHTLTGLDSDVEYIVGVSAGKGTLPGGEWSTWMFTMVTPD